MSYSIAIKEPGGILRVLPSFFDSEQEAIDAALDLKMLQNQINFVVIPDEPIKNIQSEVLHVYSDGSCLSNPGGAGGWAFVTSDGEEGWGFEKSTTSNRMEIQAAIGALKQIKHHNIILYSDSQYLIKTMTKGWQRKKNQDLWRELDILVYNRKIKWKWVRGHSGNFYNEKADKLAGKAAKQARAMS